MLVIIGADEWGNKGVPGLIDGFRESTQSWRELLLDLKRRGLEASPELAVGDGALGFWTALHEVYGQTRVQRCWVHKTANVLNATPKSVQPKAKAHLKDIWMAETKAAADTAFDFFVEAYGLKYDRAAKSLSKDRADLLTFYDFRPSTGNIYAPRTPSKAPSPPSSIEPPSKGLPQPPDRAGYDPPTDALGQEEMAQARWAKPPARDHPGG